LDDFQKIEKDIMNLEKNNLEDLNSSLKQVFKKYDKYENDGISY